MSDFTLTTDDTALLREYLSKLDDLNAREPQQLPPEIWDKAWPQIQATGEIPAEYRDRIGVNDVKERKHHTEGDRVVFEDGDQITKGYYDIVWESWNSERAQLDAEYHDVMIKALRLALTSNADQTAQQQSIIELLESILADRKDLLPEIVARKLETIDFPIDKVNSNVWQLLEDTKGQLKLNINVAKRGSKKPIDVLYSLDFASLENVSITRKLEPYDKRVYLAIAAIFNDGYDVMSVQQIYNAMGYSGRAGASDIKKINTAITKMNSARLYIDNLAEHKSYKYDHFKYDGILLPMERVQAIINGQIADAAIHVFREPPMVSFARERKQITTLDIKLLDTPLSKTNANIQLEDYLLEEIAKIKHGSRNPKILYKTMYEHAGITQKKQRQRAPEKVKQLLDYYVECGHIKGYAPGTLDEMKKADGVTLSY